MKRHFLLLAVMMLLLAPNFASAGMLQNAAFSMMAELDAQVVRRLGLPQGPAKGTSMIVTTPVDINNLEAASPLARQMAEELSAAFVQAGYRLQEIRKGKNILFQPGSGETLLTRRTNLLDNENVRSAVVMTGTYVRTARSVRFNIRMVHAPSNEVLAMSSMTLPVNREMYALLGDGGQLGMGGVRPTVSTRLNRGMRP